MAVGETLIDSLNR